MAAPGSTRARGRSTEDLAAAHLEAAGLLIVDRNVEEKLAEVDLVARDEDGTHVFVEVRGRKHGEHGHPLETVDARKQARIVRGATAWLVAQELWDKVPLRFDVIAVTYDTTPPTITWIKNAFEAT